jgi:hypothetical protein
MFFSAMAFDRDLVAPLESARSGAKSSPCACANESYQLKQGHRTGRPVGVVDGFALRLVVERGAVFGDVYGRQLVALMSLGDDPVEPFGADDPAYRARRARLVHSDEAQPFSSPLRA